MKMIVASLVIASAIIFGAFVFANKGPQVGGNTSSTDGAVSAQNVTIVDGKQIIEINARGGYSPRKSVAKAGIPTVLRFKTSGTFDCSSSIRIPSLNISQILPQSGATDIEIGSQNSGALQGMCGMGMYRFEVDFQG